MGVSNKIGAQWWKFKQIKNENAESNNEIWKSIMEFARWIARLRHPYFWKSIMEFARWIARLRHPYCWKSIMEFARWIARLSVVCYCQIAYLTIWAISWTNFQFLILANSAFFFTKIVVYFVGRFEQQNHQVPISFALIHKFPILDHIRTS